MEEWKRVTEWNDKHFPSWRLHKQPIFFSNALAGEVGELCNLVKKYYGGGTNKQKVTNDLMGYEAVDVLIYMILFCESIGISLKEFSFLFDRKIEELTRRMKR